MNRFAVNSVKESIEQVKHRITSDLTPILGVVPDVGVMLANEHQKEAKMSHWNVLETSVNYQDMTFDSYNESPDLLDITDTKTFKFRTSVLRSNCRITSQPDWGDVYIKMVGESTPSPESMLKYIVSMRKENHFHEEICECIYKRLYDKFSPTDLIVACFYTRRGGIDINPIRYSSKEFFLEEFPDFLATDVIFKTVRQ
jgi:7-cyano-7-deazaguanine reductase